MSSHSCQGRRVSPIALAKAITSNPRVVLLVSGRSGGVNRRGSVRPRSFAFLGVAAPGLWSSQRFRFGGASLRHPSKVQRLRPPRGAEFRELGDGGIGGFASLQPGAGCGCGAELFEGVEEERGDPPHGPGAVVVLVDGGGVLDGELHGGGVFLGQVEGGDGGADGRFEQVVCWLEPQFCLLTGRFTVSA
jgi:hypothetical protein